MEEEQIPKRDLTPITCQYGEALREIRIMLDANTMFSLWLCDFSNEPGLLTHQLLVDLSGYHPRRVELRGDFRQDPWEEQIIPVANQLSQSDEEEHLLIVTTEKVQQSDRKRLLRELVRNIDDYREKAGGARRYPVIFITPQEYLQLFFSENEETMPNWQGFRGRLDISVIQSNHPKSGSL